MKPFPSYPMCSLGPCSSYTGSWQVSSGACSVSCGTGTMPSLVRCSTGTDEGCDPNSQWNRDKDESEASSSGKISRGRCTAQHCRCGPHAQRAEALGRAAVRLPLTGLLLCAVLR